MFSWRRGVAFVPVRNAASYEPAVVFFGAAQPEFYVEALTHSHAPFPQSLHALTIVRMNKPSPSVIERIIWGRSRVGVPARVEVIHAAVRPGGPHELRDGFGKRGVAALA